MTSWSTARRSRWPGSTATRRTRRAARSSGAPTASRPESCARPSTCCRSRPTIRCSCARRCATPSSRCSWSRASPPPTSCRPRRRASRPTRISTARRPADPPPARLHHRARAPASRRSRYPPRDRAAHRVRQRSPPHRPDQDLRRRLGPSAATYLPDQPGLLMRSGETLASEVLRAHRAGWQLWIHAIGDRAQDLALDALESALAIAPRADPRHRIEHLGNVWREPAIERAKNSASFRSRPRPSCGWFRTRPRAPAAHRSTRSARCSTAVFGRPATPTPPARRRSPSIRCSASRARSCAPTGTGCR